MLSPSEIQSLFGGLQPTRTGTPLDGTVESGHRTAAASGQFTLPLAMNSEQQAALQKWQAAFAERWEQTWPETLRRRFSLGNTAVTVTRLRDLVVAQTDWHRFQIQAATSDQTLWMAVDHGLATAHLNCLLGADETTDAPGAQRTWGPLERQLTGRLIQSACQALLPPAVQHTEWHIKAADSPADWIADAPVFLSCELVQFDFEIHVPGSGGHLMLGIPSHVMHAWSEFPISAKSSPDQTVTGDSTETVAVRATLEPIQLLKSEFEELQIGDVLLTGQNAESTCLITVNGEPTFQATIGSHEGHKAVRLVVPPSG